MKVTMIDETHFLIHFRDKDYVITHAEFNELFSSCIEANAQACQKFFNRFNGYEHSVVHDLGIWECGK